MTETNTPSDIPDESGIDVAETDLDLPELPGEWEWLSANHSASFNGKVNVFFGYKVHTVGGYMGEIDNYQHDGEIAWDVHIRGIEDLGVDGTRPDSEPETCEAFDSLDAAIEATPEQIGTHYAEEPELKTKASAITIKHNDDGVKLIDRGSAMSVTIPSEETDDAADFLYEHAGYWPSERSDDPDEHARDYLSEEVSVVYWVDGMFGFTDDERKQTVTFTQENMAIIQGHLRDHEGDE